jgi:hypothetical protein
MKFFDEGKICGVTEKFNSDKINVQLFKNVFFKGMHSGAAVTCKAKSVNCKLVFI